MDPREAAQYGNLPRLKELLDSGEITANWTDSDECSLLHWAAINNRLQVAELLIRHKCNVNAVGGVLRSTPLHWSARQGHVMMVALLVRNGAIVDKRDVEGFSALHCAAQSGATPVVAYLIAKGQPVDCLDEGRMTPAMWAAFKCTTADPLQILITLGADVNKSDSSYMNTPLHWATVSGNLTAMKTLIRANCDLTSVNRDNESALDIAVRKADVAAIRLLEKEARKRGLINATFLQKITERPKIARRVLFLFPFLVYFLIWCILRLNMPFAIKGTYLLLIALFCKYLPMRFSGSDVLEILPISFAIASKIVLILTWFFYLQQVSTWYMQIAFSFLIFILPFTFFTVSYSDPGYIVTNYQERCKTIIGVSEGIYPSSALCSTCILLRPVRSKHCRYCNKCVARMDHHCPWVNNCIALNNHRSFILYLMTVVFATLIFDFAILSFWFDIYGSLSWEILKSCDQWLLFTFIVSSVSAVWCFCMLVVQIYQILLEVTTNERLNAHRYAHIQVGDNKFDIRSPYSKGFTQNLINFFCGDRQNEQSSSL